MTVCWIVGQSKRYVGPVVLLECGDVACVVLIVIGGARGDNGDKVADEELVLRWRSVASFDL